MEFKTITLKEDATQVGEFVGYASTWTRQPDSYGDVVAKGAFADTLAAWEERGAPIPALWGHRMDEPSMFIGTVAEAEEDDHGLRVRVSLDLDNPTAAQVHRLLKARSVAQMSFAFDIREDATVEVDDGVKARELRKLDLYEVSVVPVGANQDTSIESVKAQPHTRKADDDQGLPFTDEQIEALRRVADEWIADHDGDDDQDSPTSGGGSGGNTRSAEARRGKAARVEAAARIAEEINALTGQNRGTR